MKDETRLNLRIKRNQKFLIASLALVCGFFATMYIANTTFIVMAMKFLPSLKTPECFSIIAFVGYYLISSLGIIGIIPISLSVLVYKHVKSNLVKVLLFVAILEYALIVLISGHWWLFSREFEYL